MIHHKKAKCKRKKGFKPSSQMSLGPKAFFFLLSRRLTSSSTAITTKKRLRRFPEFSNVRSEYKSQVVEEAQKALIEYLHATKSLPFVFAEQIANNSLVSLSKLLQKIPFSARTFSRSFKKLLRYEPINEFEFFLESIGIDYHNVDRFLPPRKFFFSEEGTVLGAACALSKFGFPWNRLGKLYEEEVSIFRNSSAVLTNRLCLLKESYGIDNLCVVGVCLSYPCLLSTECELDGEIAAMFYDLKRVFLELDEGMCVEGNVDAWYELCCKVRIFHELGCEKGKVGEVMCGKNRVIFRCPREVLVQKVHYFSLFGASKIDVGMLLLQSPEILSLDLETPVISVLGLLKYFGLSAEELQGLRKKYPHVLGRNKMANLPHVVKASDLHVWCFDRIKSSNGQLLATYIANCLDEDEDEEFVVAWKRIESKRNSPLRMSKVDFLKGIGFGENALTMKLLSNLHGSSRKLRERFDFFLGLGIRHSELCSMMIRAPHILCQNPKKLEEKVNFLRQEMGCSLEFLVDFPRFLHFDLDTRIKRRHRFYVWLRAKGLYAKKYSISHMLKSNEKNFVERLFRIHPAAPKHYLECF